MSKADQAPGDVQELVQILKSKNHSPRLDEASVVVCFDDEDAFKKDRFNWGKTKKFPPLSKAFPGDHYDFVIILPYTGWEMLTHDQRLAWLDLRLETCQVEYVPETVIENKKKKPVVDEFGRTVYTDEMKRNKDGQPRWKILPLDLPTYVANVKRYGCWVSEIIDFQNTINKK